MYMYWKHLVGRVQNAKRDSHAYWRFDPPKLGAAYSSEWTAKFPTPDCFPCILHAFFPLSFSCSAPAWIALFCCGVLCAPLLSIQQVGPSLWSFWRFLMLEAVSPAELPPDFIHILFYVPYYNYFSSLLPLKQLCHFFSLSCNYFHITLNRHGSFGRKIEPTCKASKGFCGK